MQIWEYKAKSQFKRDSILIKTIFIVLLHRMRKYQIPGSRRLSLLNSK